MSTRIVRAPVRTQQGVSPQDTQQEAASQKVAKGAASSSAANQTSSTHTSPSTTPPPGRFEAHTGHDPLLNQGQTKQVRSPRASLQRELTGGPGAAVQKDKAKGGGRIRGKRALALLGGGKGLKVSGKAKAKAKATTKGKSKTQGKSTLTAQSKSKKTNVRKKKTRAGGVLVSKGKKGIGKKLATTKQQVQTKSTTTSKATGQGTTSTTKGASSASSGFAQGATSGKGLAGKTGTTVRALRTASFGVVGGSGGVGASTNPAGTADSSGEKGAQASRDMGRAGQSGVMAGAGKGEATKGTSSTWQAGASTSRETGASQGTQGKAQAQVADSSKAAFATGAGALTAKAGEAKQTLSLKHLMLQGGKGVGDTGRTESRDEANSPRQQLRQLVKQWTNAAEATMMQNLQVAMPNDVAAVAWKLASLAQSGALPKGELLSMLSKVLKKQGGKKQIDRIKALLLKKGMVAGGMSADTLALIAAMVAMYLGKQGNIDADDLIEELFGTPSRGLDFVLPEGGGSFHEEGREQQAHEDHAAGRKLPSDS